MVKRKIINKNIFGVLARRGNKIKRRIKIIAKVDLDFFIC